MMFLLILSIPLSAQYASNNKKTATAESRIPSSDIIKEYANDRRFSYIKKAPSPEPEHVDNSPNPFLMSLGRFIRFIFTSPVVRWILIAIVAILVIWLIAKRGKVNMFAMLRKSKKEAKQSEDLEDIEDDLDVNFDKLIKSAIEQQNYRLAIRLHFLKNLKILSDKDLIKWNKKKTNNNYINEIANAELRKDYTQNARIFDYVWYGEFAIDETNYNVIFQQYDEFYNKVRNYAG